VDDVPPEIREHGAARRVGAGAEPRTFHELKAEAERQIVVAALERHDWHITRTAEALGLADHASLLKIMRRHGISRG
jgi:transcriptional regulator of acetoin/glycerol metabolism